MLAKVPGSFRHDALPKGANTSLPIGVLASLHKRAENWLRASLRRWLVLPIFLVTLFAAVLIAMMGSRVIGVVLPATVGGHLLAMSELMADVVSGRADELDVVVSRVAANPLLAMALQANDQLAATTTLRQAAVAADLQAAVLVDADPV